MPMSSVRADMIKKSQQRSIRSDHQMGFVELIMPRKVKVLESFRTYNFVNLVSELGSWLSMFLGLCLLDIHTWSIDMMMSKLDAESRARKLMMSAKKTLYILLTLICLVCISWQLAVCFEKFQANPLATRVGFEKMTEETAPAYSFCQILRNKDIFRPFYNRRKNLEDSHKNDSALVIQRILNSIEAYDGLADRWSPIWTFENQSLSDTFLSPKYSHQASFMCQTVWLQYRHTSFRYFTNIVSSFKYDWHFKI